MLDDLRHFDPDAWLAGAPFRRGAGPGKEYCCETQGAGDVGFADGNFYGTFFCCCAGVRQGLRAPEIRNQRNDTMNITTVIVIVLTILLLGYLVVALLYPERF